MSDYFKEIVRTLDDLLIPVTSSDIAGIIGGNSRKVQNAINYERDKGSELIKVERDPSNNNRNTYSINREYFNFWVNTNGPM